MPLRKGEKRPESNVGFRILEYPIGRWLATRVTPRMLVEQSLRGSVEKQEIVDDAMIDRSWELLLFPGNREAKVLRARIDRDPEMAASVGGIGAPKVRLSGLQDRRVNPNLPQQLREHTLGSEEARHTE